MEHYGYPIHYKDENGIFKEIDNSLVTKIKNGNEIFKNAANSFLNLIKILQRIINYCQ